MKTAEDPPTRTRSKEKEVPPTSPRRAVGGKGQFVREEKGGGHDPPRVKKREKGEGEERRFMAVYLRR